MATATIDELLREESWVRSLARRLVRDEARADDLVQETWVAALQRPPREGTSLRPWLATVIRNRVRQDVRGGHRRRAREEDRIEEREVPAPEDLADLADQQRRVVEAVLALGQPHRNTVLLHYYGGLAPREIAKREGIPASTVRTQLSDARKRLRHRLDTASGGDGRTWALHLIPLAVGGNPQGLAGAGLGLLGGVLGLLLVVGVPLGLGWRMEGAGNSPSAPDTLGALGLDAEDNDLDGASSHASSSVTTENPDARTALGSQASGLRASAGVGTRPWLRVVDVADMPIAGAEVSAIFQGGGERLSFTTDEDGIAQRPDNLQSPRDLRVRSAGCLEWRQSRARGVEEVTLYRTTKLLGRVVDPLGKGGVHGVRVAAQLSCGDHEHTWSATTRDDGGFRLEGVPCEVEFDLDVGGPDQIHRGFEISLDRIDENERVFSLPPGLRVRGRVVAAESGLPLAGAKLYDTSDPDADGRQVGITDPEGWFDVLVARTSTLDRIDLGVHGAGRCTLRARPAITELEGDREWMLPMYLPTRIEGRVLSESGDGAAFVDVELLTGAPEIEVALLREASRGAFDPHGLLGDTWLLGSAGAHGVHRSDREGNFALGGLVPYHPWVTLEADVFASQGVTRCDALAGPGEVLHVDIVAVGKGGVEGVLRVNGVPGGGVVSVFDSAGMKTSVMANSNGRFRVSEVPSGPARLAALADRFGYPPEAYMIEVEIEPGAFLRQDIEYSFDYLELGGIVVDGLGNPAAGMTVRLAGDGRPSWSDYATTDKEGLFSFQAPSTFAPYSLSVDEDLGDNTLARLSFSDTTLVFEIESRAEVDVLIHRSGSQEPITDLDLYWRHDSASPFLPLSPDNIGPVEAQGWRSLALPAGSIELWVQPKALELQAQRTEPWILQAGADNPRRPIEVHSGAPLEVQGTPDFLAYAERYTIWVLTPQERATFLAETQGLPSLDSQPNFCPPPALARRILHFDRNGRARLLGLPPGPWTLVCSDPEAPIHPKEGLHFDPDSPPLTLELR